jgi:catechol 2,3-dioxygenase-like lactoylglutathione lyase family enzyme
MTEETPLPLCGLRHLALRVNDLRRSRAFYQGLLGMRVVWEPDDENLYLSSGSDNLALHQVAPGETLKQGEDQFLDHFGFIAENESGVDQVAVKMREAGVPILKPVKRHRDGSYSFYMADPDGNVIQILYEPHISPRR